MLVDLKDDISFRQAMYRNPLHANMNYHRKYHDIPDHIDEIVREIVAGAN